MGLAGCGQSPVRNPFAGRVEPKLGALPEVTEPQSVAGKVTWSNGSLSKQIRFSKLQPHVVGDRVYIADQAGKVMALQRDSGKMIWKNSTGKRYLAGPFWVDNHLVLTTSDAKIIALAASTGEMKWEKKVSSEILAPMAGAQGFVFAHATDGSVMGLRLSDGEEAWRVEHSTPALTLRFCSAPVVVGERVLVGLAAGKMIALDLRTGTIEWERTVSLPHGRSEIQRMVDISADPVVMGDVVYAVTYQGKLAAIHVLTGDLLWERDFSSYQNMASDAKALYLTDNAHYLWALDRFTGSTLWKQEALAKRYITGPAIVDGRVVVADRAGILHYLAADNGHIIDRLSLSGKIYQSPIRVGDMLFVSTFKGKLVALRAP